MALTQRCAMLLPQASAPRSSPAQQHPWAGHNLPHDDPGGVCQQLARWLAGP